MSQEIETARLFYELTPEKILSAVENKGFICTGRCLPLNSMENRVLEVEIEVDADKINSVRDKFRIVKFYRPGRWTKEQIQEEHQFLFDLMEAEIPVIAPLRDESGESVFEMQKESIYFAVFPKGGGRAPDELNHEQARWLGRLLARMHTVGASRTSQHRIVLNVQSYGRSSLEFLLKNNFLPLEIRNRYVAVLESIFQKIEPLFADLKIQRLHGDCHAGNILWGNDGPFFVDFDDMVVGPVVQDMWLIIAGRDQESMALRDSLVEGYEEMRDFNRSTLRLIEPLRTLRMIHYSAWIARRWEDPAFKRVFTQFGSNSYWQEELSGLEDQLSFIE